MNSPDRFIVEVLDPAVHSRENFTCGVPALDEFLTKRARKEMEAGISVCFVLVPESARHQIAGYYTLSAATIIRTDLPESAIKKLPRYHAFPATLLGRLARDLNFRGQRVGERLMASALYRAVSASREVASWAIVTDPKDENARRFYSTFGFLDLTEVRMFLPMKQASDWTTTAP